jgi:hypothetical protein
MFTKAILVTLMISLSCMSGERFEIPPIQQEKDVLAPAGAQISLRGECRIPQGMRLTLPEGTVLIAQPNSQLIVAGELNILGTNKAPVVFSGQKWNGIKVQEGAKANLNFLNISGASVGIMTTGELTKVIGKYCRITQCGIGVKLDTLSVVWLYDSIISKNTIKGYDIHRSTAKCWNCEITDNGWGVYGDYYPHFVGTNTKIVNNSRGGLRLGLYDVNGSLKDCWIENRGAQFLHEGQKDYPADSCWWGAESTAALRTGKNPNSIRDSSGVKGKSAGGKIITAGFLSAPPPDCGVRKYTEDEQR